PVYYLSLHVALPISSLQPERMVSMSFELYLIVKILAEPAKKRCKLALLYLIPALLSKKATLWLSVESRIAIRTLFLLKCKPPVRSEEHTSELQSRFD